MGAIGLSGRAAEATPQWLVEKNGFLSPNQAREQWNAAMSIRPAD